MEVSGAALLGAAMFGGGGPGSLAIPATGYAARRVSRGMIERAAQRARNAVAAGPDGVRTLAPPPMPGASLAAPAGLLSGSDALDGFGAAHAAPAAPGGLLGAVTGFHGDAGPTGGAPASPRDALVRALASIPPEARAQRPSALVAALMRQMEGRR